MPPHQPPVRRVGPREPSTGLAPSSRGPVDPDVDVRAPGQLREWTRHRWVLPTIAVGGMLGAVSRHALDVAWSSPVGAFPWATFVTNVTGCLLIGILMVQVVEVGGAHPLARPFLGVGVLGGFTTFSTYSVQTVQLLERHPGLAAAYYVGTLVAALLAVVAGVVLARGVRRLGRRTRAAPRTPGDRAAGTDPDPSIARLEER